MLYANTLCTAFAGSRCLAQGTLQDVAPVAKRAVDQGAALATPPPVLVFNDATSEVIELVWRGSEAAFAARMRQRHGDQLLRYCAQVAALDGRTARAALYFPRARAWIDL